MKLSLEVPIGLPELLPLTDFDFILAQDVLTVPEYRMMYVKGGRPFRMLDNGFHELGRAMAPLELMEAVRVAKPNIVISPDNFKDVRFTLESYREMRDHMKSLEVRPQIAVVMSGETEMERIAFYEKLKNEHVTWCFPYRVDRVAWHQEIVQRWPKAFELKRIHLLGWRSQEELAYWRSWQSAGVTITMDTSKPVKWGMLLEHLGDIPEIRHAPVVSDGLTHQKQFTMEQRACIYYNIAWLRTWL